MTDRDPSVPPRAGAGLMRDLLLSGIGLRLACAAALSALLWVGLWLVTG